MTEKMKSFWRNNAFAIIVLMLNLVFLLGSYYSVIQALPTEKRVREIVKEEIETKFSVTDGKVLETRFNNLDEKLNELKQLFQLHNQTHK